MKLVKPAQPKDENNSLWSNCIIDFEDTSFAMGVTIDCLSFSDYHYQSVTPLSPVFGSDTTVVCTVGGITKSA
jgi:hypothetical protein